MQASQLWRFGPFTADAAEHRLLRDGAPVALTRKAFALLAQLLSRPGKLITKAELFESVWAGSVVTDSALSQVVRELRAALGDDASEPCFIATAHGLGFRFVAPVLTEPPAAEARAPSLPSMHGIIGRDLELTALENALANARAGKRQVVFVTGEAGIGKTALVQAFVQRHVGDGELWTAQGRCIEQYGPAEPYLPILEALESLAQQVGVDKFRGLLERHAPAWLSHLPGLAHDADRALLHRARSDSTSQSLLLALARVLEVLAAERPVVLWLEDLHWGDPSSLAVVSFLAGRRDAARILVLGSFRRADAMVSGSPLHGLTLQLLQRSQASEVELGALDAQWLEQYLRARCPGDAGVPFSELSAFLHRRTEGNALFAVAMVEDLVRRRKLHEEGGTWTLQSSIADLGVEMPDDLRRLVHEQIDRLSEPDRQLMEVASVAGIEFSAAAVAAALQADTADVEERCARLARHGRFLRAREPLRWPDGTVAAAFGFVHALYWQGIDDRISHGRRAEWQRRIGVRLEQAFGAQSSPIAGELAIRFETARDIERSIAYLHRAADVALGRCAYLECIDLLKHALTLLGDLPEAARARQELELLLSLGPALMAAQGYASADVESTYQRAAALCRVCARSGELERVLRGLWNVAFLRGNLAKALEVAERLQREGEASGNESLTFDAHTMLGHCYTHRGELASARMHLERALAGGCGSEDVARRRGAPRAAAYLSWVLWFTGHPAQALQRADAAMASAGQAASPHSTAIVLGYVSWLRSLRGEQKEALALARRLAALSGEHGFTYWRLWADFMLAREAAQHGDGSIGIAGMRRAIDEMRTTGGAIGIPNRICALAEAELSCKRPAAARLALAEAASLRESTGNVLFAAEAWRLQGEIELAEKPDGESDVLAEASFTSALTTARRQGARALELRAATSLARLWAGTGEASRAAALLAPTLGAFSEGFETSDLMQARQLLDSMTGVESLQT